MQESSLQWSDLEPFLAALDHGTLTEAARRLGVQQSTVSRRIQALERALGQALFLRTRRGLVPTALAERIEAHARAVAAEVSSLRVAAEGLDEGVAGRVRVATSPSLASYLIVPNLVGLRVRHPALQVDVLASTSVLDLTRREADIALRFARPHHGELVVRRVGTLLPGVLGHRQHARVPWEELPWGMGLTEGFESPEQLWFDDHVGVEPVFRTNDYPLLVEAVRHGLCVAVLSRSLLRVHPEFVELPSPVADPPALPLYLVAHARLRRLPRVATVWDAIATWVDDALGQGSGRSTAPEG